ncbi:PmoA family protein [Streptomyces gulbargensis]|uniref:PmoA family protein n=1 Tax=Streptomyces gulbargensis TaxID=364901 RepID=A0ABP7LNW1_9ACTN
MKTERPVALRCAGRTVARYTTRPDLAADHAPRPHLHPVTTLAGRTVTETVPGDHRHHLGAGVAVPDVAGYNFWGGRTFVRDRGPVALDNHGVQHHDGFKLCDPDGFVEELSWTAGGERLLREHRTVAVVPLTDTAWALDLTFSLANVSGRALSIGSPATNGRPGAAYGGFFWRAPKEAAPPAVFGASGDGEETVHGVPGDWVALVGREWSLVFAGATATTRRDPWFVRAAAYPGVGSSLASGARLPVAAGETVVRRVVTVVADGRLDRDGAAALARRAVAS